jgi:hypothetical protein
LNGGAKGRPLGARDGSAGDRLPSVPTEHKGGEGKHERLESQNQRMDEPEGVHDVKKHGFHGAGIF